MGLSEVTSTGPNCVAVGYGDITPHSALARVTVVFEIMVGLYLLAIVLAVLLLSQKTTNDLTQSIRRLTVWLIVLTIAITATTLVLAAALWKTLACRAFLPVGGIKDKVLAAHRAGLRTVILPRHNSRDVEDVPEDVWRELTFHFVDDADDVLRMALTPAAVAAERAA